MAMEGVLAVERIGGLRFEDQLRSGAAAGQQRHEQQQRERGKETGNAQAERDHVDFSCS